MDGVAMDGVAMDALARLEPVARGLLREVDVALATLGAPADHPIWALLRRLGATPADAVSHFAECDPARLHTAAAHLREQAQRYGDAAVPVPTAWAGSAAAAYRTQVEGLTRHLSGEDGESLRERIEATASYVEESARWLESAREIIARALADVLGSAQAVAVRVGGVGANSNRPTAELTAAVTAAADIGAHLLAAAEQAATAGQGLPAQWAPALAESPYRPRSEGEPVRFDETVHVNR